MADRADWGLRTGNPIAVTSRAAATLTQRVDELGERSAGVLRRIEEVADRLGLVREKEIAGPAPAPNGAALTESVARVSHYQQRSLGLLDAIMEVL